MGLSDGTRSWRVRAAAWLLLLTAGVTAADRTGHRPATPQKPAPKPAAAAPEAPKNAVGPGHFAVAPYVQNTSTDAVSVCWETLEPLRGAVLYGQFQERPTYGLEAAEVRPVRIHRVRLTGLQADTRYAYRVSEGVKVHTGEFHTAPAANRPVRFAVLGDSRFWKDYWEQSRLPEHLAAQHPEFLLHVGDLVLRGPDKTLWPAHFARFGSLMASVPLFAVRGNHEGDNRRPDTDWYAKYFELPGGEPYASFDWGNSHFTLAAYYAFRSNTIERTTSFLDRDLAAATKPWKFTLFHYPVYCAGYLDAADKRKAPGYPKLEAVFDRRRVDLSFAGHTHIYERSFPLRAGQREDHSGTAYVVQGGNVGGSFPERWSAVVFTDMDMPHYTLVEVKDDHLELRSFGLAKGSRAQGKQAPIIEIDRYIRWRDERLPQAALGQLANPDQAARLAAIADLGAMLYAPAAERLAGLLKDPNKEVREAAALALERIAAPEVAERLLPFLRDPDLVVRRRAARALEGGMPAALAPQLEPLIGEQTQDPQVRVTLLGAVLHQAPERAYALGLRSLADKNPKLRDRAADVVKWSATRQDLPELMSLFRAETRAFVSGCLASAIKRLSGKAPVAPPATPAKSAQSQ